MQYARNERLTLLLMRNVYYQLQLYRFRASTEPGRAEIAFSEHEAIVGAIGERDRDKAEQLMRLHIRNSFASLAKAQLGLATSAIKVKPLSPKRLAVGD